MYVYNITVYHKSMKNVLYNNITIHHEQRNETRTKSAQKNSLDLGMKSRETR